MFGKRTREALSGRAVSSRSSPGATNTTRQLERNQAIVNFILSHLDGDQRPYLQVSILGVKLSGLLDSGATRSILGKGGWNMLKNLNLRLDETDNAPCKVADGKRCRSLGSVTVPVLLMNKIKLITLLVVPDIECTLILGKDFWRVMEIIPDLETNGNSLLSPLYIRSPG